MVMADKKAFAGLAVCSRGYLMKQGQIVFEGTDKQLSDSSQLSSVYLT